MSSYFAIYRGWVQHGAEHAAAHGPEEALTWDFSVQPSRASAADSVGSAACGALQRPVARGRGWLAPLRRWAGRRAVSEHV
jgi:hypothetical protein